MPTYVLSNKLLSYKQLSIILTKHGKKSGVVKFSIIVSQSVVLKESDDTPKFFWDPDWPPSLSFYFPFYFVEVVQVSIYTKAF